MLAATGTGAWTAADPTPDAEGRAPVWSADSGQGAALTAADLGAYLDGLVPHALDRAGSVGMVITVVKDGQILLARGYGHADKAAGRPVDPARTLYRVGSVSKLFTWIAVMQQVEAGRLELDRDVNAYLDFKIPERFGTPITLRRILTHTTGFDESVRDLFHHSADPLIPLEPYLATHLPDRIYPPGSITAYSNYATTLAAHIVERVSGIPFETYVVERLLGPLGMAQASFRQPLPDHLAPDMSVAYDTAGRGPQPLEYIQAWPAGSLSASGLAMAKFMTALLDGGRGERGRILDAETLAQMWTPDRTAHPSVAGMALGFYETDRNGYDGVGHAGNTEFFHSDLHLVPALRLGIFLSISGGDHAATGHLRQALYHGIMDRYFPGVPAAPTTGAGDGAAPGAPDLAGAWLSSRRQEGGLLSIGNLLDQTGLTIDADGVLTIDGVRGPGGQPIRWRPVAPDLYQREGDQARLAVVRDPSGLPVQLASDNGPPIAVLTPVPGRMLAAWNLPLLALTLGSALLALLLWPVGWAVRRSHAAPLVLPAPDRWLRWTAKGSAAMILVFLGGLLGFLASAGGSPAALSGVEGTIRSFQVAGVLALLLGATIPVLTARLWLCGWRSIWVRLGYSLLGIGWLGALWFAFGFHLLDFSLRY